MTDGALPTPPTAVASPVSGTSPWKLYLAAAIGAFLLGLSDYFRNGSDSTVMVLNNGLVAPVAGLSLVPVILLATPFLGVIAAWIYRPSSERDAFALGFAVFSLFALGPEGRVRRGLRAIECRIAGRYDHRGPVRTRLGDVDVYLDGDSANLLH